MQFHGRTFNLVLLLTVLICSPAFALYESFELYSPPQAHSMGYALTADASGVLATFFNPAGLAKGSTKKWEVTLLDLNFVQGIIGFGSILASRAVSTSQVTKFIQNTPGFYNFYQMGGVTSFSRRNLSIATLYNYRYAAESDGTSVDIDSVVDIAPALGISTNVLGNRLKLGVTGKAIIRNQLQGVYTHAQLPGDTEVDALSREGVAVGFDVGAMYTWANRFLPTIGVVWKDVMNTNFLVSTHLINARASGLPNSIPQSINIAGSLRPRLGRRLVATAAFEIKHLEDLTLPLQKRIHFGIQFEDEKSWYFWIGMNRLFLSGGFALRLPGGNLELSTYGEEIGIGDVSREDRRFALRYTIGF